MEPGRCEPPLGIASALVAGRRAELGLFEVDEGALPRLSRGPARAPSLSETSFATNSTATASSRSWQSAGVRRSRSFQTRRRSSSTRTTPSSRTSPTVVTKRFGSGSTILGSLGAPCSMPPTRSTACGAARRTPTQRYTSGISATTAVRSATTTVRSSTSSPRTSSCAGCTRRASAWSPPPARRRWSSRCRACTTSTTRLPRRPCAWRWAQRWTACAVG